MVHLVVVKLFQQRQWQMSAALILFRLKVQNYLLCGLVKVRLMLEMFLTRLELLLHAYCSLMSWIQLQFQEALLKVMQEEQGIELSINYLLKWMEWVLRKISSLLEPRIDHKFQMKHCSDQDVLINLSIFLYQISHLGLES